MRPLVRPLAALGLAAALALPLGPSPAEACTRALYVGPEGRVLTGRTMDWKLPIVSNLWVFPRGTARSGMAGPRSLEWTADYGSVMVSGYDIAMTDGMNEAGLVVNMQWEATATYPADDGATPRISVSIFGQFLLDRFATVAAAVDWLRENPLHVATGEVPMQAGRMATVHFSLSDATGDSAIVEWLDGAMRIFHDRAFRVMTNEPAFDWQLAIAAYWQDVNPREFLPGTSRATDRFVRAEFYLSAVEQSDDPRIAAAATFSVIRNASVPWGISTPDAPNLSTTRWRVVADQKDRRYYFESAVSPSVAWVDLARLDFAPGAPVLVLDTGIDMGADLAGDVTGRFAPAPHGPDWAPAD